MTNSLDMPRMGVDFETKSELDVRNVGAWRYSEDPSTEILCLSYRLPGQETKIWIPPEDFPQEIIEHIENGFTVEAHNAQFEMAIWINVLNKRLGIPVPTRWADTMAVCAYKALPLGLDKAGAALDLSTQKDKRGKYLIQRLCKRHKPTKNNPTGWIDDQDLLDELYDYCIQDTDVEHLLGSTLGDLPLPEYRLWVLDQIINKRGVRLDVPAVEAAVNITNMIDEKLTKELVVLTNGAIETAGQRDKILAWIVEQDYFLVDMTKKVVEEALEDRDMPDNVRRLLEIRQQLSRASAKKLVKMLDCVCEDGRIRGLLQYHGASTGRWAGRLVQPQNFPRGTIKDVEQLIATIKTGDPELLAIFYDDPMEAIASSLRGMFISDDDRDFCVSDFSAIEACVLAWVADEEWKLQAFYDKEPIYEKTAELVFGYPVNKKDNPDERQVGKTCELAFGYQGGVNAWRNFDSSDMYTDEEVDHFKNQWRDRHPKVVDLWYGLEEAAISALKTNKTHSFRGIIYQIEHDAAGKWLTCTLPNNRKLWYYDPKMKDRMMPWDEWKNCLSYMGRNSKQGGRWDRIFTYGGMLVENVVQAISRDLMAEAMIRVEKEDYPILLTVHDEIISEPYKDHGSLEEYNAIMSEVPIWATGCPVSVDGWRGTRYRK